MFLCVCVCGIYKMARHVCRNDNINLASAQITSLLSRHIITRCGIPTHTLKITCNQAASSWVCSPDLWTPTSNSSFDINNTDKLNNSDWIWSIRGQKKTIAAAVAMASEYKVAECFASHHGRRGAPRNNKAAVVHLATRIPCGGLQVHTARVVSAHGYFLRLDRRH